MKRHKNVYMGPDSTAGIIVQGHVDQAWEILLNAYATAFDSLDGLMLTRVPGKFDPATEKEIVGRFWVLRRLAYQHAPNVLPAIERLEQLCLFHLEGRISSADFLESIRNVARESGLSEDLILYVESKIIAAGPQFQGPAGPAGVVFSFFGVPGSPTPQHNKQSKQSPGNPFEILKKTFGFW